MHFFRNSVSFIAVMCVCGVAYSATSPRVGMATAAATSSRRLPTISSVIKTMVNSSGTTTTATTTTTQNSDILLSDTECIDDYRDCMKADSACGSGFEECTTNVLFHGHMSECFSTLYQCSSSAIKSLFGTSDITVLSDVDSYVADTNNTEVARYKYPTDGSIMGMDIIGAATRNKLSTSDCVKKYKRCLTKDTICGEDFELCTSDDEFKKQAVLCDSTLSRCQKEGFQQLFGESITTKPANKRLKPNSDGDVRQWIDDGATLAASNAVNTCYKVVDNCFANACAKNPYRCVEGINIGVMNSAEFVADAASTGNIQFTSMNSNDEFTDKTTTTLADVRKFFRASCEETIGANKYCQMTFLGRMPKKSELQGEDAVELYEEVFDDAYATRNNKNILGEKVTQLIENFDKSAKGKCIDTFKSCAVRSCGGGSGAACYAAVFEGSTATKTINGTDTYDAVKAGCEGVVNMDANCVYMSEITGTGTGTGGTYNYTFSNDGANGAFATLFPRHVDGVEETIAVTALNADLSTSYNSAAIQQMKRQCQNLVENCVKSMCGKDFQNCYRNRSDVFLATYSSGNKAFDKSMNQVGGVLDYTIVQGLCSSTIRNADACSESLAIAKLGVSDATSDTTAGWGTGNNVSQTVTNAWNKSASMATIDGMVNDVDANGKRRCECDNNVIDICADQTGATNMTCTKAHRVSKDSLMENKAVAMLFQDILGLVEQEAQAQYKAKLTKEQNVCLAQNSGANPNPTFVWSKLSGSMPSDYSARGLGASGSVSSNDLYGSFCRVKVELRSSDTDVQNLLAGKSVTIKGQQVDGMFGIDWLAKDTADKKIEGMNETAAYFATGDSFTCGSWVSSEGLNKITEMVGAKARKEAGEGSQSAHDTRLWTTLGVGTVGGIGSFIGMNALQKNGSSLGGLLNPNTTSNKNLYNKDSDDVHANSEDQQKEAEKYIDEVDGIIKEKLPKVRNADLNNETEAKKGMEDLRTAANNVLTNARSLGISLSGIKFEDNEIVEPGKYVWNDNHSTDVNEWKAKIGFDCRDEDPTKEGDQFTNCTNIGRYVKTISDWFNKDEPGNDSSAMDAYRNIKANGVYADLVSGLTSPANAYKESTTKEWKNKDLFNTYEKNLNKIKTNLKDYKNGYETESDRKDRLKNNLIAGGVGAVVTGALANGIVSSVQKAKYEDAENEAVKAWMENVGSKIECYVGGQRVASFGDTISIDISED